MSRPDDPAGAIGGGAVITAFDPDASLLVSCRAVLGQVDVVVVVDDGSAEPDETLLAACGSMGALVVRHATNRGIGAALNTGLEAVRERLGADATAVLTLDQDSAVPDGYVRALLAAGRDATAAGVAVGMVGPAHAEGIRHGAGRVEGTVVHGGEPIQSGLLVPVATFDAIGRFDESLFIDGVDTEFYLRARAHGLAVVVARGTTLAHRLGRERLVALGPVHLAVTYAADFRYYYIARNRVELVRRFGRRAPGWAFAAVVKDLRHLAITTTLVPGRWSRLRSTFAGFRDGVRGRTGTRPIST